VTAKEKRFPSLLARFTALLLLFVAIATPAQAFGTAENRAGEKSFPRSESPFAQPLQLLELHQVKTSVRWFDVSGYVLAAENAATVENLNPAEIRFSQNTAGGRGRADILRQSMGEKGWAGDPVDAVRTPDGVTSIDNTRVAVARELGVDKIPVRVHAPNEPLPPEMAGRFGNATTWGEALAQRTASQRPPLPPTGTLDAPRMPAPKN
jgi:hypothetical protein